MGATYRALCEHGYAALTMRDIAEESDRSKAALHYHYDDKEGLLLAFLDHLYEEFTERFEEYAPSQSAPAVASSPTASPAGNDETSASGRATPTSVDDPDAALRTFLDAVLHPPHSGDAREFRTAMLEIKAQAPYDSGFRERIARFDDFVARTVRSLVVAGQDAGVYRQDVDPDHVAQFVLVVLDGAGARHVVAEAPVDCAIASVEDYLDAHLLVDGDDGTGDRSTATTDGEAPTEGASR